MVLIIFLLIGLAILVVLLPIVAIVKAAEAKRLFNDADSRLRELEKKMRHWQEQQKSPAPAVAPNPEKPVMSQPEAVATKPAAEERLHRAPWSGEGLKVAEIRDAEKTSRPPTPPSLPPPGFDEPKEPTPQPSSFDWEQFMGAKLFTWIGGIALFFGVAFFLKYSFDHGLIPPELRVAIGFLFGALLLGGGIMMRRKETAVTAQTLCSIGILVLYGVSFAAHALYRFELFGSTTTFLLMSAITGGAFYLSVRLNAISIAILGMAGGFLTPVLLSSGQNAPLALFGYIALLDVGLLAVALKKRWNSLPLLGALGTVAMQVGWAVRFFDQERYYADHSILIPMSVFFGFQLLFLAAVGFEKWRNSLSPRLSLAAGLLGAVSIIAAFCFLQYPQLGERPLILFSYLFLADLALLALVFMDDLLDAVESVLGLALFYFLIKWTFSYCNPETLYLALGAYLVFTLFHTVIPVFLCRWRGTAPSAWINAFPALSLMLILVPIFRLASLSALVWPVILMVNLLAIGMAVLTATLLPIVAVLLLTLLAIGTLIFRIPADLAGLPFFIATLGGFSIFFMLGSHWAARKIASLTPQRETPLATQVPILAATMPFLLLIMAMLQLNVASLNPILALALLLVVILLGMARSMSLPKLAAIGLGCVTALEAVVHLKQGSHELSMTLLGWHLGFYGLFAAFPFVFRRHFENAVLPWGVAAIAAIPHFFFVSEVLTTLFPWIDANRGIVSAAFAIPPVLGLAFLWKETPLESPARNGQLAWFGGVALFFITLIFPLQFEREWITLGWALEGMALCALFHRVPHPGLRFTGVLLLTMAFVRLAFNPAVLSYHPRAELPILNWYLYTYGVAAIALFFSARLLAPPRNKVRGFNIPPVLYGFGAVLLFLLLNIEIADYFTAPNESVLTFEFSGNIARDLSYTIGWALFALALLLIGIWKKVRGARFASIGLFLVTLSKLFLHDLWQLDQLYRIVAFIVVPIIAMLASFLYQRFLGSSKG